MERDEQPRSDDGQSLALRKNDVPKKKKIHLKFSDEVLDPVHTRRELKGKKGYPLQVALLDETGKTVKSSALVEIVLADASGKDDGHNATRGNFDRRIIKIGDKKKPHFANNVYINLEGGVGNLNDVKLGQPSDWTKNCKCSLGARLVEKFRGSTVQEGWTAPFLVKDYRGELYKKHDRPFLYSEVWRLKGIGRSGKPHKRLEEKKIKTVRDLLFWLSVNHEGLQKILEAGDIKWKTIVEHARTCNINDKKIYFHKSSPEPQMGVIYDVLGDLKGVINESHFIPIDNLSADNKEHAHKLLSSVLEMPAFVERYKTFFDDEASLLQWYPYKSSDIKACTNSSIQQSWNGDDLTPSGNVSTYQPKGTDSSSPCISPLTISIDDYLDDKKIYFHKSSPEPQMGDFYDVVGDLKGVINESHFIPIDNLSADNKEHAHKLLSSVLELPATFFDDEASLLQRYPYKSSDISASEYYNGGTPTDQGCRSQNAGTFEVVGEWSCSTPSDRVISMTSSFEDMGGVRNDPWYSHMANIQKYSHTDESNADDETVESQAVNTSNPPK